MKIKQLLQRWFKLRFAVFYPFAVYFVLFTQATPRSICAGAIVVALGAAIRIWANAYIMKMDKLTVCGPYAFVRNPLYFGTIIVAVGFAIMLRTYIVGSVFTVVLVLVYLRTIRKEQGMLAEKFGADYTAYAANVPALLPRLTPYATGERWPFSVTRLYKNKEYKNALGILLLVVAVYLREIILGRETIGPAGIAIIAVILCLGIIDFIHAVRRVMKHKETSA